MQAKKLEKLIELMRKYDSTSDMAVRSELGKQIDDYADKLSDRETRDIISNYR